MKHLLIILALCGTVHANDRIETLSMLETGDNDRAVGKHLERSRWQMLPYVRREYGLTIAASRDPKLARPVVAAEMARRVNVFNKKYHRAPSDFEWAIIWHAPHRVLHPTSGDRDYAQRFCNILWQY